MIEWLCHEILKHSMVFCGETTRKLHASTCLDDGGGWEMSPTGKGKSPMQPTASCLSRLDNML